MKSLPSSCTTMLLVLAALAFPIHASDLDRSILPREATLNGVEFVLIPGGEFWYTVSSGNPDHNPVPAPQHRTVRVHLDDYYIARYEARIADLQRFMNSGAAALPVFRTVDGTEEKPFACSLHRSADGHWQRNPNFRDDNAPAAGLSWALADAFARWMGFRLPTEAEWQKAARGPLDRRLWPWGDAYPDDSFGHFAFSGEDARCQPALVTSYPKGRSPYGVYNMAGNVAEWVADWYNSDFDVALRDGTRNPALASTGSLHSGRDQALKLVMGGRWGGAADGMAIPRRKAAHPSLYFNVQDGVRFATDAETVRRALSESGVRKP